MWNSRPTLEGIDPSVPVVELVVETSVSVSAIVDALDHEFIRNVDHWRLEATTEDPADVTTERSVDRERTTLFEETEFTHVRSRTERLAACIGILEDAVAGDGPKRHLIEEMRAEIEAMRSELPPNSRPVSRYDSNN
ncbi:hypothetical protein [Natrarchaeobius chitinivorans]|uniref:Uncharacterized protein n=1 Tax=Natrarchaeobius chitinivorans TaxID=1679083 RepID=A0A3N6PDV9_NATCH|nr:hypothetical protein [Natrarchaeobius chitinivorans]RQG97909.1 hypothetical protein EA473_01565 [Natrarchaeobius chitinivorans]